MYFDINTLPLKSAINNQNITVDKKCSSTYDTFPLYVIRQIVKNCD